ncbi:flagellar hook-basal body protein [Duganella radicis]|uniref:Flagellar hook-basal body complex protein n=1 Tax=Duganella radicis TaxID=551988 RepID=A0A6L6PS28_9BURK|nr:flagellar hook-basal body protein [Duganella radicis]MTV41447.1 flagellar hook-basal body complex protein [Duganella radicis]
MDITAVAASGMQNDLRRVETISQNMANLLTPGYKKQILLSSSFARQVDGGLAQSVTASGPSMTALNIDPAAGTLRYTGNPQDMAIDGTAFFEVAGPQGPAYTRQGGFHVDVRGRLVNAQGYPVMGMGGEIVLSGPYAIDPNGDVRQGDQVLARLKLVHFSNPEALEPQGGGGYRQGGAVQATPETPSSLRVGYQENSNVNSAQEMVRLTETVRHFEAMQKVMQGYDDSLEKTIRKLGDF